MVVRMDRESVPVWDRAWRDRAQATALASAVITLGVVPAYGFGAILLHLLSRVAG